MTSTRLRTLRRAHIDVLVLDEEVAAFDQFDADLVGEERVLVIGRVEHAERQQRDGRALRRAVRGATARPQQQFVGIVVDRRDAMAREQVEEKAASSISRFSSM